MKTRKTTPNLFAAAMALACGAAGVLFLAAGMATVASAWFAAGAVWTWSL